MTNVNKWGLVTITIIWAVIAITAGLVAGQRKDTIDVLKHDNRVLVAQNKQLTADIAAAKADAFRAGIIACENEDVAFLNEKAEYFYSLDTTIGTLLGDYFDGMAQSWTYDDNTLNEMTESYMEEGTD